MTEVARTTQLEREPAPKPSLSKVDLVNGSAEMAGLPVLRWDRAYIIAKDPSTRVFLTKDTYRVDGPAQYGFAN